MDPFQHLDELSLLDALAEYTSRYSKMGIEGALPEEFKTCKETIEYLMFQIDKVKKRTTVENINLNSPGGFSDKDNTTISHPDTDLPADNTSITNP